VLPTIEHKRTYAPHVADLDGKRILVTGANTGIGRATAEALAARGAHVVLACRSEAKARPVVDAINGGPGRAEFVALDLGDLASVRACAEAVTRDSGRLDVLINNAGLAGHKGLTASGFELAFGTNYVGPFLLTNLLLDRLRESTPARIVNLASDAHYGAKGIDFAAVRLRTKSRTAMPEYSVSKLANVLHAQELARRLDGTGVTTYSLHPGVIASDIWRRVPWPIRPLMKLTMRSPQDGARTPLYCATAPDLASESGLYYENAARKEPSKVATADLGAELWRRSDRWLDETPP
jgi:retinol dehydrogenase 12